ncbi:MAG TPA: hypothetical protein VK195_20695, partial [Burkholderiaceae bacterium]|nr:hypothetical protein [Burkholderiaceae bacterium]
MFNRHSLVSPGLLLAGACSLTPLLAAKAAEPGATPPAAQVAEAAARRPIAHSDYAQWRSIQGAALSRDGRFATYALVGQESDGE